MQQLMPQLRPGSPEYNAAFVKLTLFKDNTLDSLCDTISQLHLGDDSGGAATAKEEKDEIKNVFNYFDNNKSF